MAQEHLKGFKEPKQKMYKNPLKHIFDQHICHTNVRKITSPLLAGSLLLSGMFFSPNTLAEDSTSVQAPTPAPTEASLIQTEPDNKENDPAPQPVHQGNIAHSEASTPSYDFLRYVTIPLDGYLTGQELPDSWTQHTQVVPLLLQNRNLALHLEILRQATLQLSADEQRKLANALRLEHRKIPDDPYRYFDVGYTRWVVHHDKSALFYLRKANDQLQNPWSNLTYALAEAEADITHERALPSELTRRKQDAMFKLTDALMYQAKAPVSGFWPAYLHAMDALKKVPAYTDYAQSDHTDLLLPFGQRVSVEYTLPDFNLSEGDDDLNPTCMRSSINTLDADLDHATRTLAVYLDEETDTPDGVYFMKANVVTENGHTPDGYHIVIRRGDNVLASLKTPVGPYIFEDLDEDGTPEIVLRQFAHNRTQPVQVYRFNGCQFEADTDLATIFK